jgi:hypothetical protein
MERANDQMLIAPRGKYDVSRMPALSGVEGSGVEGSAVEGSRMLSSAEVHPAIDAVPSKPLPLLKAG